jgi:hypothetical protein
LFRDKVGGFPTTPPSWYRPDDTYYETPVAAAFEEAWKPYRSKHGPIYGVAATMYNEVRQGTFVDRDTRMKRTASGLGN